MEIYDNGYLTEEEKDMFDTQALIYLAASLYANDPVSEILPKYVYKYGFDENKQIYRWKYTCNQDVCDATNTLWDIFVHGRQGRYAHSYTFKKFYFLSAYLDNDGKEIPWNGGKILRELPIHLAGSEDIWLYNHADEQDTVYFLEWKPDCDFLMFLQRLNDPSGGAA